MRCWSRSSAADAQGEVSMVIRTIIGWLSQKGSGEIFKKKQEERALAEREAERPVYSPEEERELRSIYTPEFTEKKPDASVILQHVNDFFEKRPTEHVQKFAYYCLTKGLSLSADRARRASEIIAASKASFRGGFRSSDISHQISDDIAQMKEGTPGRNLVGVILRDPEKYKEIFTHFYKKPPGGTPLFTEEEWKSRPPRRGSGSGT